MVCPTPPPLPVNVSVYFDAGTYASHLETPSGQLNLKQMGNCVPVSITINQSKSPPGVKFYKDPQHGYGVMFSETHNGTKRPHYDYYKVNHQFDHSITSSDGMTLSFVYNNDETGGQGNGCNPKYATSDLGFIIADAGGTPHQTDPIVDNGSNQLLMGQCMVRPFHRHHRH